MQVNVKAMSDALDGLLEDKALNHQASRQWHNPAIIQKLQPPRLERIASNTYIGDEKAIDEHDVTLIATDHAVATQEISTSMTNTSNEKVNSARKSSSKSPSQKRPKSADPRDPLLSRSLEKEHRSRRSSRFQQRNTENRESRASTSDNLSAAEDFFEQIRSAEVIPVKPVEASGLGIGSVLLTPHNVASRIESAQLPSKSWATSTSLTSSAHAVLQLTDFKQLHREQLGQSPQRHGTTSCESDVYTVAYRNVKIAVLVDSGSDGASRWTPGDLSWNITVETSNSRRCGFITVGEVQSARDSLAVLSIPGTLLSQFLRVTVKPLEETVVVKLIRVRALCILWDDTWTSVNVEQTQLTQSLEEEVEEVLQSHSPNSKGGYLPEEKQRKNANSRQAHLSPRKESLPTIEERVGGGRGSLPEVAVAGFGEISSAADLVKTLVLSKLCSDSAERSLGKTAEDISQKTALEYNWLSDQLETRGPERVGLSRHDCSQKTHDKADDKCCAVNSALSEYIATLQAWNSVPSWSIEEAIDFCMMQTTSFSASTISAAELFNDGVAAFHLTQPFKVHFLITFSPSADKEVNNSALPSGATPPPLTSLSAVATQAASLGFSFELLFKSDFCSSFGCVLRPESSLFDCAEERFKLLLVVPSHDHQDAHLTKTEDVVLFLLTTALNIFLASCGARKEVKQQPSSSAQTSFLKHAPAPFPHGVLRLLIDGTESFGRTSPVLTKWSEVAGPIRYYGDASQPLLNMLLAPSHFAELEDTASSAEVGDKYGSEAQWSRLHIKNVGEWKVNSTAEQDAFKEILALELQARSPANYAWQSTLHDHAPLRLLLTDNHVLESAHVVDGFVLPPYVRKLAERYLLRCDSRKAHTPSIAPLSETPWIELLQLAKRVFMGSGEASGTSERDAAESFFSLRRRVATSFAFYILSTAFKRGWERVGVSVPASCAQFNALTATGGTADGAASKHVVVADLLSHVSVSFLDEDAFMDTLVQWRYPFPKLLILHCTALFGDAALSAPLHDAAASSMATSRCNASGIATLFSRETLSKFCFLNSFEEALT